MDHLQKKKKEYKYLHKQEIHNIFIKMNLITCFRQDMAYQHFKDLTRRTASDKMLRDKAFNIAKRSWTSTWTCFNGLQIFLIKNL